LSLGCDSRSVVEEMLLNPWPQKKKRSDEITWLSVYPHIFFLLLYGRCHIREVYEINLLYVSVGQVNCCWPSPAQSFLVPRDHILLSHDSVIHAALSFVRVSICPPNFFVFCAVHVLSKGSKLSVLPRTSYYHWDSVHQFHRGRVICT
jgi:hypothetical protein